MSVTIRLETMARAAGRFAWRVHSRRPDDRTHLGIGPAVQAGHRSLNRHGETWLRPLAALGLWPTMGSDFCPYYWLRRGVIDGVEVNVEGVLPGKTNLLFQAAPAITRLSIQVDDLDVAAIVACPQLRLFLSCPSSVGATGQTPIGGRAVR